MVCLSKTRGVGGAAGSPRGAAIQGCGQCPWSSGTPCTEREMSGKKGMEVEAGGRNCPQQTPSPNFLGGIGLTLRSMASDFCRSKFRAVGRWKEGVRCERGCLAVILSWSWAGGGAMEGTGALEGTFLSCPLPSPGPEREAR